MRRSSALCVILLVYGLGGCRSRECHPNTGRPMSDSDMAPAYSFCGRVAAIVMLEEYEGKAIRTGVNDNYVVTIEEVIPVSGPVPDCQGGTLAYAVHSPTKMFAAPSGEVVGGTFEFTAWTSADSGPFLFLQAREIEKP